MENQSKYAEGTVMREVTKRIRNLKKKSERIDAAEKKLQNGGKLDPEQHTIISSKPVISKCKEELENLKVRALEGGDAEERIKTLIEESLRAYREGCEQSPVEKCIQELQKCLEPPPVNAAAAIVDRLRDECENMIKLNPRAKETLYPNILKCIEDLDKLLTAVVSDSSDLACFDQISDLVNLIYCGSLFTRKSNRVWVSSNLVGQGLTEGDLVVLSKLGQKISPPLSEVDRSAMEEFSSHKNSLEACIRHATNLVHKSEEIFPSSSLSYAVLNDKIKAIISSAYINTKGMHMVIKPDFATANIKVFWDFENCTIPVGNSAKDIAENIKHLLRKLNYKGPFEIYGYGSTNQLAVKKYSILRAQGITIDDVPKQGTKDAADKKIIVETMVWVFDELLEYHEPQVVMLITSDIDFAWAIQEVKNRNFELILVHKNNTAPGLKELADKTYLWSAIAPEHA